PKVETTCNYESETTEQEAWCNRNIKNKLAFANARFRKVNQPAAASGPVGAFLSWKFFMPLSKITFCAYLLHPIMLQIYNLSRPQPFHFTTFIQMVRYTFEAVFVSYLMAFFFALAFEKPFNVFDEMLIPKNGNGNTTVPPLNIQPFNV
ncbi:unnamed protein product, partial [Heligmosomoides polygyrus]